MAVRIELAIENQTMLPEIRGTAAWTPALKGDIADDFDITAQPSVKRATIAHLAQLDFLAEATRSGDHREAFARSFGTSLERAEQRWLDAAVGLGLHPDFDSAVLVDVPRLPVESSATCGAIRTRRSSLSRSPLSPTIFHCDAAAASLRWYRDVVGTREKEIEAAGGPDAYRQLDRLSPAF